MKKKMVSMFLASLMFFTSCCGSGITALAANQSQKNPQYETDKAAEEDLRSEAVDKDTEQSVRSVEKCKPIENRGSGDDISLADSETLFQEYVENVFRVESTSAGPRRVPRRNRLSAQSQILYDEVKKAIIEIANGTRSSTSISIPLTEFLDKFYYTKEELEKETGSDDDDALQNAFKSKLNIDFSKTVHALMDDLPYEFYWYDKTSGYGYITPGWYSDGDGYGYYDDDEITIQFDVAKSYSKSKQEGTRETDTELTSAASKAAEKAKNIALQAKDMSEDEALAFFKKTICDLTDYNNEASESTDTSYGDPWQLIYVFDDDPSTKVVCEGYAKAFKYLCDLYRTEKNISDSDFDVYLVAGNMKGDFGSGSHMWNVVWKNGNLYLADITNSDSGMVGEDGSLFMTKADSYITSNGQFKGYSIQYRNEYYTESIDYVYDDKTLNLFDEKELKIGLKSDEGKKNENVFQDVNPNQYFYEAILWGTKNAVVAGYTEQDGSHTFHPDDVCTRAQFVTFLWRTLGSQKPKNTKNPFVDIKDIKSVYFSDAVLWAYENGYVSGYSDPKGVRFGADDEVTRGQVVTFLWRAAGSPKPTSSKSLLFVDVKNPSGQYYGTAMLWASENGIVSGYSDPKGARFAPDDSCTRGQVVTFLWRYAQKFPQ